VIPPFLLPLQPPVAEVEKDIRSHHGGVETVEYQYKIKAVKDLVQNTKDIAYKQNHQEEQALSLVAPGLIGPNQRKGPGSAEAGQHQYLKDAHGIVPLF
jgi:hypothetical protein